MHPKINSGNSCRNTNKITEWLNHYWLTDRSAKFSFKRRRRVLLCLNKPTSWSRTAPYCSLLLGAVFLSGCATTPAPYNARVEDRNLGMQVELADPQGDQATPLDQRYYRIQRAEQFEKLAASSEEQATSVDAALSAGEFYVQANDGEQALRSVASLDTQQMSQIQQARFQIILAYIEYQRQEYQFALDRLGATLSMLANSGLSDSSVASNSSGFSNSRQVADALLLSSFCYQQLTDFDSAIAKLIEREGLLFGAARAETSRYIWQVISTISVEQRQSIIQSTEHAGVRNRFEQSLQGQIGSSQQLPSQFEQWRGQPDGLNDSLISNQWSATSPRVIAVLLPLSSRFQKAAQAVLDGINYQHSLNSSIYKPRLDIYDIGDNPLAVTQYQAAALQNGAQAVLGPLGKDYADQMSLAQSGNSNVPTILLGGSTPLNGYTNRLSLSPERQASMVSDRAEAQGFVTAALLVPDTANGLRTAQAFQSEWLNSGGKISQSLTYSPTQFDHSTELKQFFDINKSEYRHSRLSQALGYKPNFTAYRRKDIDFVFMIADEQSGRVLRPQINFFSASKRLPVLAPSSIYNGIADPTNNIDLDQTSFPVMPWILASREVAAYAGQLNMLFAMGTDVYSLASRLSEMQNNHDLVMAGNTGKLRVSQAGEITYDPVWATFSNGIAETDSDLRQINPEFDPLDSMHGDPTNQQGEADYDESNWDRRQSRRKTSP